MRKYLFAIVGSLMMSMSAQAALVSIPLANLLGDANVINFESSTPGTISGNNSVFTNAGFANVSLFGSYVNGIDTLSSGITGNSLIALNGLLSIGAPGGALADQTSGAGFSFDLLTSATQFGFKIVDQVNFSLTISTFFNGSLVDSINFGVGNDFLAMYYFESSTAFDSFRITQASGSGSGWGLDNVTLAGISDSRDVPAPAALAFIALAIGLLRLRRR